MLKNKYFILVSVALSSLLTDQLTKAWIRLTIDERGRPVEVIPGLFRLVHAENEGAAWGIMRNSDFRMPFFYVATLIALSVIVWYYVKLPKEQRAVQFALAFILGGALGNFIDRLLFQSVTDFLEFYVRSEPIRGWLISTFGSNRWPSFNIADTAIVIGLVLVMWDMFVLEPRRARREREGAGDSSGAALSAGDGGALR